MYGTGGMAKSIVKGELSSEDGYFDLNTISKRDVDGKLIYRLQPAVYKLFSVENGNGKTSVKLKRIIDRYPLPDIIFGDEVRDYRTRLVEEYDHLDGNQSALLVGKKGAGKTTLAECLANDCIDRNMPVILIDTYIDVSYLSQLTAICTPVMLQFEEFGKNFGYRTQNSMLSFFSDKTLGKNFLIFTENSYDDINDFMRERPGRIKWKLTFDKIKPAVVQQMCFVNGLSNRYTNEIVSYSQKREVTMDQILHVIQQSKNCESIEEFRDVMTKMNVPALPGYAYNIIAIESSDTNENISLASISINLYYNCDEISENDPQIIVITPEVSGKKTVYERFTGKDTTAIHKKEDGTYEMFLGPYKLLILRKEPTPQQKNYGIYLAPRSEWAERPKPTPKPAEEPVAPLEAKE